MPIIEMIVFALILKVVLAKGEPESDMPKLYDPAYHDQKYDEPEDPEEKERREKADKRLDTIASAMALVAIMAGVYILSYLFD